MNVNNVFGNWLIIKETQSDTEDKHTELMSHEKSWLLTTIPLTHTHTHTHKHYIFMFYGDIP